MIEINLLPPQYRTVERTPLPVFLGVIGAIVVVAGLGMWWAALVNEKNNLITERDSKKTIRDAKAREVEEIKKLEREIADSQGRIDTVLGIAESKIYWAAKLDQLMRILPSFAWVESVAYDGNRVVLACKARGTSLQRYTELRQRFRNDTNFMYNFDPIPLTAIDVIDPGPTYLERAILSFQVMLPIRQVEQAPAQPAKK
jgi:Tfp pilus assembly protein PilN